jgi:hypothetical protein
MTYEQNISATITGEILSRLVPRNLQQAQRKWSHKDSTIPNEKHVLKLIKYWKRTAAK